MDYAIKREPTGLVRKNGEWFFPWRDPEVEKEERARVRSAIYTDQGEYATGLFQIAASPESIFYYSNESEEDPNFLLQKPEGKDEEEWRAMWAKRGWIELDVRENTLREDPLSLLRFSIIPLKKGVGQKSYRKCHASFGPRGIAAPSLPKKMTKSWKSE